MKRSFANDGIPALERLRGMHDVSPAQLRRRQAALRRIMHVLERHGYEIVETPILEPTELFLRKSGPERIAQLYAFTFRERDIALRPEHTASILRYYVQSLQTEPLPIRLAYAGPVFRYERPQAGRSRQFTEVGCELLGAPGASGDAEVIHLAAEVLQTLGIKPRIVLGHVGIVLDFLERLPLRQRARDWLLWTMERLRKGQPVDLETELPALVGNPALPQLTTELRQKLEPFAPEELEQLVLSLLQEAGIPVWSTSRTPKEIVRGVLAKLARNADPSALRRAFHFAQELAAINGTPSTVLPELHRVVTKYGLDSTPLQQLEEVLTLLEAYGIAAEQLVLSPGMARGLHYYTGILFEIYADANPDLQLCGGGRYDDLAQILGARSSLPACGFSGGLERICELATLPEIHSPPRTLVAATSPAAQGRAQEYAEKLRQTGAIVELDVRQRSPSANRRYARRRGISRLVLVDPDGEIESWDLKNWDLLGDNRDD